VNEQHDAAPEHGGTPARRRGGRRRLGNADATELERDRRQGDRRQRPGYLALLQDILLSK
jgi:hypothetical protein